MAAGPVLSICTSTLSCGGWSHRRSARPGFYGERPSFWHSCCRPNLADNSMDRSARSGIASRGGTSGIAWTLKRTLTSIVFTSRSFITGSALTLSIGVTIGVVSPLLGAVESSIGQAVHLVLDAGWSWAALAFCVGLARKSRTESIVLASASLIVAVVAYYLTKLGQGEFLAADLSDLSGGATYTSWHSFLSKTVYWVTIACVLGPLLGWAGNMARKGGLRGLAFRLLVPVIAVIDTSERLRVEAALQGGVAEATWSAIRLVAVAVILVLVGCVVIARKSQVSAGPTRE